MQVSQPNLLNSAFKQDNIERLYARVEEFRKIFLNLQKFLLENYNTFHQFGKNLQKIATSLEEYLKNYISDEKNCYFMAKYISVSFFNFGDDFSKIFNGLSKDMNSSLNEILEKVSQTKINYLDVLMNALTNYCSIENLYLATLNKYKKTCKDAEDSLIFYNESQKEAKSIYNLSIMKRNLAKVKSCVQRVGKYERKLKDVIELLNSKRKAFSINVLETIQAFKESYKYFLVQFYEMTKKNGDALSSFISMFTHIIHEKKIEFSQIKTTTCLPVPSDFGINKKLLHSNNFNNKINNLQSNSSLKFNGFEDWPDFLQHPEEITDINLLDYADWAQNYVEKVYEIAEHRRKIMKHLRICLQEYSELHDAFSKNLAKLIKNNYLYANWSVVGDEIFTMLESLNHTLEAFLKNMGGFGNFVSLKIGGLESVLLDNQKNLKISYSSACKTIKDHTILRNKWLKVQNSAYKTNKPKAISLFSSTKDSYNLKEAQNITRKSIIETANIIQTLIGEYSTEEKKKIVLFKETTEVIFSQMEFYFNEVLEFLRTNNENIYKNTDKVFVDSAEKLFSRLISNDLKINELYKSTYQQTILQEKDKDIVFVMEFDKENHPIYQKIIGNQSEESIQMPEENHKRDLTPDDGGASDNNINNVTPTANFNNQIELFPPEIKERAQSCNDNTFRSGSKPPTINVVAPDEFDLRKFKSQSIEDKNLQENPEKDNNNSNFMIDQMSPLRKKSLDLSICSGTPDFDNKSELNSPISIKSTLKPFRCMENLEKDKSKFSKNSTIDPDAIINQQIEKNSNFDLTASPKKKKSTYTFFKNKFGLAKDELIDDLFSCALLDKILIQGKIFISNKKICFHSYFNRHTFIGETKMIIPKNVILRIEKRVNAIIFDNSIAVITSKGEIFFTSFVYRDKAYVSILKMIQPPEQKDLNAVLNEFKNNILNNPQAKNDDLNDEIDEKDVSDNNEIKNIEETQEKIDPEVQKKVDERAEAILLLVPKEEFYKDLKFSITFTTSCKIDDVYRILFSNNKYTVKGKEYKGFWEYLKVAKTGDYDFNITEYDPPPPEFFQTGKNLESLVSAVKMSQRKMECTHPLKKTGVPFMPKTCPLNEIHKVYWISNNEFQVINEIRSEKVPYSDSFFITALYHAKQNQQKVDIVTRIQITFVKKTMMQGTIEKTVINETTETTNQIVYPAMEEFLRIIYKSKEYREKFSTQNSAKKAEKEADEENNEEEENAKEVSNEELDQIKKKNKELEERVEGLEGKVKILVIVCGVLGGYMLLKVLEFIVYFFI